MKQIRVPSKILASFVLVITLGLTGCASLPHGVPTPSITETWTLEELSQFRRIRNDPRLYGIKLTPEQYLRYLQITGQVSPPELDLTHF